MNEQKTNAAPETVSSHVVDAWKCPKCGANNKFNPNICTSCNYSKIPPVQVLPPQSRRVWEKISFVLIGLMIALQLAYAVTMAMGVGLTLMFGIEGPFLQSALICPDMILYSHYSTAGVCAALAVVTAFMLVYAIKNNDKLAQALHIASFCQCIAVWTFPVLNILTDMVVTSIKKDGAQLRPTNAYDLFDMGITLLPSVIITIVALVIIYVNNRLAPSNDEPEDE